MDDFTTLRRLLTDSNLFIRKLALFLCLVLSTHPANASPILDLLAHEFVLDSATFDPPPAPSEAPQESDKDPIRSYLKILYTPPANRLRLGPPYFDDLPEGISPPSFRVDILFLIRHIAHRFLESDQPEEIAVFRHAMDLLEQVMLSGDTPPLRCLATCLLEQMICANRDEYSGYGMTGLFAPAALPPQAILVKWGDVEAHVQHFFDLAATPQELLRIRDIAIYLLYGQLTPKNAQFHFPLLPTWGHQEGLRLLRLTLDILWEAPAATKWDVKRSNGGGALESCFWRVWEYRYVLPPPEYARFLDLIRQALAFPLATPLRGDKYPRLYGGHPWPGWYLLKQSFAAGFYDYTDLFLRDIPEEFMFSSPEITKQDKDRYPDTTEELERLLLDLIRSPADLALLWEVRHWAKQESLDFFWGRYLLHAQAKFPPTKSIPTLMDALRAESTPERHQAVVKLGALAHTGALPDPTEILAPLATAVQDADFWVRLLAIEGLRGFVTTTPSPLALPLSVLHALQTAVLQDPAEVIQTAAMETLHAVVTTATLPDPPLVATALLEITTAQARIIRERSYDPSRNPMPRQIRNASDQALLTYLKRLENPSPLFPLLQSEKEDVRAEVAWALGQLGDPRAVPLLIQALQDDSQQVRASTAEALGALGDSRAIDPLIQGLQDLEWQSRGTAALALGQLGDPRAIEALIQALQDSNYGVRLAAAQALGELKDARAIDPLLQALQDPNWDMYVGYGIGQQEAINALRKIGALAVAPLLHMLQETKADPDSNTHEYVIKALGQFGDVRAVEPLIQVLITAESRWIREAAVEALGQLGDPRAVDPILQVMGEEDGGLIIYDAEYSIHNKLVLDALVQIGAPAVAPLTRALNDPNPDVQDVARVVLAEIEALDKRKKKD